MLGSRIASGALASHGLMNRLDGWLGADPSSAVPGGEPALPPYASLFLILGAVSVVTWLAGTAWMTRRQHTSFADAAASWGFRGWLWWLVGGSWELARLFTFAAGSEGMQQFVLSSPSFWIAAGVAGWVATFFSLASSSRGHAVGDGRRPCRDTKRTADPSYRRLPRAPGRLAVLRGVRGRLRRDELAVIPQSAIAARRLGYVRGAPVESVARQGISQLSRPGHLLGRARAGHSRAVDPPLSALAVAIVARIVRFAAVGRLLPPRLLDGATAHGAARDRPSGWPPRACSTFRCNFSTSASIGKHFAPTAWGFPFCSSRSISSKGGGTETFCLLAAVALGAGRLCDRIGSAGSLDRAGLGTPPTITRAHRRRPAEYAQLRRRIARRRREATGAFSFSGRGWPSFRSRT